MVMDQITVHFSDWVTDREDLLAIRSRVFIEEQNVPAEIEIDDLDSECWHVKALNQNAELVGVARMLPDFYIGRMCVLRDYRGQGIGGMMLSLFIDFARQNQVEALMLNAQITAIPFYENHGFTVDSPVFVEAGIEHRHMTLQVNI